MEEGEKTLLVESVVAWVTVRENRLRETIDPSQTALSAAGYEY
jgi:hypothetical protein